MQEQFIFYANIIHEVANSQGFFIFGMLLVALGILSVITIDND